MTTDLRLVFHIDEGLTWLDIRSILAPFIKLRRLKISGVICREFFNSPHKLTLPDLTYLAFVMTASRMPGIIYNIVMPMLNCLELTLLDGHGVPWLLRECAQMGQAKVVDLLVSIAFSDGLLSSVLGAFTSAVSIDIARFVLLLGTQDAYNDASAAPTYEPVRFGMRSNKEVLAELSAFPVVELRRRLIKDFRRVGKRADSIRTLIMTESCYTVDSGILSLLFPRDQYLLFSNRQDAQARSLSTELKYSYMDRFEGAVITCQG
ncbi:hypothetical protein C8R47DRAFT_1218195 [Mycena vitilis]|nr:hypothetical protein C8R47DRAFT_1218195 [Mycena vitilis]